METWLLWIVTCLVLFIAYIWQSCKRPKGFPPGPPCVPILGSIPFIGIGKHPLYVTYTKLAERYGPVMSIAIGNTWTIVLTGYPTIRDALIGQSVDFAGRGDHTYRTRFFNPKQIGIGLCQYSDEWKAQRNVSLTLLRAMGYGKNTIEARMKAECNRLMDVFRGHRGRAFDPSIVISKAVCNVMCFLCFGQRYTYDDVAFHELMHDLDIFLLNIVRDVDGDFVPIMRLRPGHRRTIKRFEAICKRIHSFMKRKVDERTSCLVEGQEPEDFVQAYYIELQKAASGDSRIHDDWLVPIVIDFFVAGADTSTTTLTWALLYMIRYPDVQAKIQREIHSVLGPPGSTGQREVNLTDRPSMPYTEAVIMETLRYSSLGGLTFKATTRDVMFKGFHLPYGTEVVINDWQMNRDVTLWGDPEVFRPERFIDANGRLDRPEYWISFGMGRRSCFGEQLARQELFLFLVAMLQKFKFTPPNGTPVPDETPIGEDLILKPQLYELFAIERDSLSESL